MRVARLALVALGVGLSACADAPTAANPAVTPSPKPPRALGLLEITFNDVGTSRMSATVRPVTTPRAGGASADLVPVPGGVQVGLRTSSTLDVGGERYIQAVFQVRNATAEGTANGRVLRNVTFIPVSTANSIAGTPLFTMRKQDGTNADSMIARQFMPAGSVMDNGGGTMASGYADVLQAYTEDEVDAIDMSAYPAVTNRYPYGFVTRRAGDNTTRDLPADPAPGQFDGSVTFAFHFPKQAASADNPFTVSIQVVAVEDDVVRITQSMEEQGAGQAAFEARAASLGATQVTLLDGGRYSGALDVRALCSVRSSGPSDSPTSSLRNSSVPAVGSVIQLSGAEAQAMCVDGGASGVEYTLMPVNTGTSGSTSVTLLGTGIEPLSTPLSPSPVLMPSLGGATAPTPDDARAHLAMRQWERTMLTPKMRIASARAGAGKLAPRRTITGGTPAVGDLWNLNVRTGCAGTPDLRTGRVRTVRNNVIIVADTANPAGGFTTAQYDSIAAEFDTIAYPVNVNNFGAPTDRDGNGRVVVFYTRGVNEMSPPGTSLTSYGYFTARDLFSTDPADCELSNVGEILYMVVPDPTGAVNANVRAVAAVRGNAIVTMTHELQHLINASRRMYVNGASSFEEVWLDEGLSYVAEELAFYRASFGLAPRGNIILSNLNTGPSASRRVAAYNTYQNGNFTRLRAWLQRPDTAGAFKNNDVSAVRGSTWGFLRYAADRKGGTEANFWSSLVNTTETGLTNVQTVTGGNPNQWLRDWVTAMYVDDAVTGIAAEYTNPSWNFRSVYGGLGGMPTGTRVLANNTPMTLSLSYGGGGIYGRFRVPAGGQANLSLKSGGAALPSNVAVTLVRTK